MEGVIEGLRGLQQILLGTATVGADLSKTAEQLRQGVPPAVLRDFESMVHRGKTGIVPVVNGVCSGCHLKLSSGTASLLGRPGELRRCDNCGRYLYPASGLQSASPAGSRSRPATGRRPRARR